MGSEGQHGGSPIYHASLAFALNHISYIYFGAWHIKLPAAVDGFIPRRSF